MLIIYKLFVKVHKSSVLREDYVVYGRGGVA